MSKHLTLLLIALCCHLVGFSQVDLELTVEQANPNPGQFSTYSVVTTVTNAGDQTATGVVVFTGAEAGTVVFEGGNEFSASQGNFDPFSGNGWIVGTLGAGQSATLTINYFLLAPTAPEVYGQVTAQNEIDADSAPGNGTPFEPIEDDEASNQDGQGTGGGGGGGNLPDLRIFDLQVPTTGTVGGNFSITFGGVNDGAGTATNPQARAFLSTDNQVSADDLVLGDATPFSTLSSGASQARSISGTVPNVPNGNYLIIVQLDPDDLIPETDETNNALAAAITISGGNGGGGGNDDDCGFIRNLGAQFPGINASILGADARETATGFAVDIRSRAVFNGPITTRTVTTDASGVFTGASETDAPFPGNFTTNVTDYPGGITISYTDPNGNLLFSTDVGLLPPNGGDVLDYVTGSLAAANGGFLLIGTIVSDAGGGVTFDQFSVRLDQNGTFIGTGFLEDNDVISGAGRIVPSSNGGDYVFTIRSGNADLQYIDATGAVVWTVDLFGDTPASTLFEVQESPDGSSVFASIRDNSEGTLRKYNAATGAVEYVVDYGDTYELATGEFFVFETVEEFIPLSDGGAVFAGFSNTPGNGNGGYFYGRVDGAGNPVWAGEITTIDLDWLRASATTGDGGFLLVGQSSADDLILIKLTGDGALTPTCTGGGPDPCDNDTEAPVATNCPANITVTPGLPGPVPVFFDVPTFSDNCTLMPTVSGNFQPNSVFPLGTTTVTYTGTDGAGNVGTCSFTITVNGGGSGVDLELALAQSTANPTQFGFYSVIATLTNAGAEAATGVRVSLPLVDGVVYEGGNIASTSQGSFEPFPGTWEVGSLGAGQSATLTVNYFLLDPSAPNVYAQVTAQNEDDTDSTPNNGTPPTPNEDDEASTEDGSGGGGGGGGNNLPDLLVANAVLSTTSVTLPGGSGPDADLTYELQNAGTADADVGEFIRTSTFISADATLSPDDELLITTVVIGVLAGGGSNAFIPLNLPSLPSGNYFIIIQTDTENIISESNENNNITTVPLQIINNGGGDDLPDLTLNNIGLTNTVVQPGEVLNYEFFLQNIGQGNASGDFTVRAFFSTDSQLSANDVQDGTVPTGNYAAGFGQIINGASTVPNLPDGNYFLILVADADGDVAESNENNNAGSVPIQINSDNGGGGNPGVDLELSFSTNNSNPPIYTFTSATLTITNAGTQTATGIKVGDNAPGGFTYEGGNAYGTPTKGMATLFGGWTIPSLAPGESASLPINYFTLTDDETFAYARVLEQDQDDVDSSPAVWTFGQILEDDEAILFFFDGNNANFALQMPRPVRAELMNAYPNPVTQQHVLAKLAIAETGLYDLDLSDARGIVVCSFRFELEAGAHELFLDLPDLAAGMYQLRLRGQTGPGAAVRLVVVR